MPQTELSITIDRSPKVLFQFLVEPKNLPKWVSAVSEAEKITRGALRVGTKMRTVANFLGRKAESVQELVEYEPNTRFAYRSQTPFPFEFRYRLEPKDGGTRLKFVAEGEPRGFFKLADPIFQNVVRRQFQTDLRHLKDLMEAGALIRD